MSITGTNLSGALQVTFNGTVASISKDGATKIKAKVPKDAEPAGIIPR